MKRERVEKMTPFVSNSQRIINEHFFEPTFIPIEEDFKPLDQSIIWQINAVFWKHVKLWQKTYNEQYESALPSGLSESHRAEFIRLSAERFFTFLKNLQRRNALPPKIGRERENMQKDFWITCIFGPIKIILIMSE